MLSLNDIVKHRTADGVMVARIVGRTREERPHYDVMYADRSIRANVPGSEIVPTGGGVRFLGVPA